MAVTTNKTAGAKRNTTASKRSEVDRRDEDIRRRPRYFFSGHDGSYTNNTAGAKRSPLAAAADAFFSTRDRPSRQWVTVDKTE